MTDARFRHDGIASMPNRIKPLKSTEFQYREDRDDTESHKRSKRKQTTEIPAPTVPTHSFMPDTPHDDDAAPDNSPAHDGAPDDANVPASEQDPSVDPSDGD